jgi:NADP-dependent 3-hydroxy acid dehydrogenase YdfG
MQGVGLLCTPRRWINNAGQVTQRKLLTELAPEEIVSAVGCNVLGSLLCCRAAIALMRQHHEQQQGQQQGQQGQQAQQGLAAQAPQYHIFK